MVGLWARPEGLKIQEDYPEISNEDLSDSVYRTLGRIIRECNEVTTSVEENFVSKSSLSVVKSSASGRCRLISGCKNKGLLLALRSGSR
jgi:hypothetical protein